MRPAAVLLLIPLNDAERSVEQVFQLLGIPVTERTPDSRVRSGRFDPGPAFGAQLEERVSCGGTGEVGSVARARPFELEVLPTLHCNAQSGTRVELESYGREADAAAPGVLRDETTIGAAIPGGDRRT